MEDMIPVNFEIQNSSIIKVIGVGGGGNNAVNYMFGRGIAGVDFVVCNTDLQALDDSIVPIKIQLGKSLTQGRGAGNKPDKGEEAAEESMLDIEALFDDTVKMVFITAGMGGGTGTGAAPIIAKAARDRGILTIGIVTIPFRFEGARRISQAVDGIAKLEDNVDSLLVINNEKLRLMYGDLKLSEAFSKADDILSVAAKSIAEIITIHGYINVDFADVETVMRGSGVAVMGSAKASGEKRGMQAIQEALQSPLLNSNDICGARHVLLNIVSGDEEVSMREISEITNYVHDIVGDEVSVIWGNGNDESLGKDLSVTIVATGFTSNPIPEIKFKQGTEKNVSLKLIVENSAEIEREATLKREREIHFREETERKKREIEDNNERIRLENEKKSKHKEREFDSFYSKDTCNSETVKPIKEKHIEAAVIENEKKEDSWLKDQFSKLFDSEDTSM